MGGDILVVSTPGRGSTFTATMRLKRAPEAANSGGARRGAAGVPSTCCWRSTRGIERRALRLSLEGAGIPSEESAIASAAEPGVRGGKGGRALHAHHRRRPRRLRAGRRLLSPRAGGGAGRRAGRHRAGYGGQGGLRPIPRRRLRRLSRAPGAAAVRADARRRRPRAERAGAGAAEPVRPVQFVDLALGAARRGQRHQRPAGAAHAREGRLQGAALRQRPRGGRGLPARARRRGPHPTTSC